MVVIPGSPSPLRPKNPPSCARAYCLTNCWCCCWKCGPAMDGSRERFPLVIGQNGRTPGLWCLTLDLREPEQAPGNTAHQRQIRPEPLSTLQAAVLDTA